MGCRVTDPRTNRRYRWVAGWWIQGQTVGRDGLQGDGSEDKPSVQMGCRVVDPRTTPVTATDTPCKKCLRNLVAVVVVVDVEQAAALTAYVSCHGCEIHGRSGFAFHSSHNTNILSRLVAIRYGSSS